MTIFQSPKNPKNPKSPKNAENTEDFGNAEKIPQHVAIIMDGNGRWAKKRGLPVSLGHRAGAEVLRKLAPAAEKMGIRHLTVYAFSTENWSRPTAEVTALMNLLREFIKKNIEDAKKNTMKMAALGDVGKFDQDLQDLIQQMTDITAEKQGINVHIALNYGGRDEIVRAARKIAQLATKIDEITETDFAQCLDTANIPDPELLIRTGGEMRLSNFMLWQSAYSEIYTTDTLWPDFNAKKLQAAIDWYSTIDRRFGKRK
ncbi:MAG: polyprenyl diphosphate synthase [Defluviitaleaceae bacterium]|nr:polyprenyl diphosphate synthase [Defluviitaleaceae bacterium]